MSTKPKRWAMVTGMLLGAGCGSEKPTPGSANGTGSDGPALAVAATWDGTNKVIRTDDEWRQLLGSESFRVMRQHGTERAFSGKLWDEHGRGVYRCAGCQLELFTSDTKFDSGTGWPSFWSPAREENVGKTVDRSLFMTRTEVHCARCDGHLGHVFEDGPKPTGLRYCINSASITFDQAATQ